MFQAIFELYSGEEDVVADLKMIKEVLVPHIIYSSLLILLSKNENGTRNCPPKRSQKAVLQMLILQCKMCARLAQLVRFLTANQKVPGSIPGLVEV